MTKWKFQTFSCRVSRLWKTTADETHSQRKCLKIFLEKGRQGNNLQLVRNCCTQVMVRRPSELFLILFSFQKGYFSVVTSCHKFLWMAMFSHRPHSCLAVFVNVRLFYHRNKFLPQCIVTWSIQNEITSFQIVSFSHRKNSQQRYWSGFATDDFVAWAYFIFRRLERDQKWKSVNVLYCLWMTITYPILNRLPQDKVLQNPC